MQSSRCPACFIFSIASHHSHLENVWSGLAANFYFARLQNDSPSVQDCHNTSVFLCVTANAVKLCVSAYSADDTRSAASDASSYQKTVYRLTPLFAWGLPFVRHAPLTVKWLKTALYCNYNKTQWIYTSDWKTSVIFVNSSRRSQRRYSRIRAVRWL